VAIWRSEEGPSNRRSRAGWRNFVAGAQWEAIPPDVRRESLRGLLKSGRDARVSLQHSVAAAFLLGAAGLAQYEDDCVADAVVRALRAKVVFEEDPAAPVESATVTLHLADGTELSQHIRHGRGTPGRPMSDAELDTKVRELAAYGARLSTPPA
jgi:2-methylcitrate dehydratase PrpD